MKKWEAAKRLLTEPRDFWLLQAQKHERIEVLWFKGLETIGIVFTAVLLVVIFFFGVSLLSRHSTALGVYVLVCFPLFGLLAVKFLVKISSHAETHVDMYHLIRGYFNRKKHSIPGPSYEMVVEKLKRCSSDK
jgi:hypothetical protein